MNLDEKNGNKKFKLDEKKELLKKIRHEIKKKRIFLDESKDKFGFEEFTQLIKVKNTSEVKGYPFKAYSPKLNEHGIKYGIKIMPVETKYDKKEHPGNLENIILKELTDNIVDKNISPHIAYYIGLNKISNKSRSLKMLNLKRLEVEEKIRTHSNMLIAEFAEGGSLDNWIYNTYEFDKEIDDNTWKSIVFQIVYTLAVIQYHYKLMHNDFHYGNILIDDTIEPGGYIVYEINGKHFYIPNIGVLPLGWDWEFSMCYSDKIPESYPNKFIIGDHTYDRKTHKTIINKELVVDREDFNVPVNYNEVYDLHFFLTSLLDLYISQDLFDWVMKLYPQEVIPENEDSSYSSKSSDSSNNSDSSGSDSSESELENNSKIETESESFSEIDTETESETESTISSEIVYVSEGRLINGAEELFDLPTPMKLINDSFFECFTKKPADFDESTAIYYKAGF